VHALQWQRVMAGSILTQLFDRMCMLLGGRVAEALTFKKITTGKPHP